MRNVTTIDDVVRRLNDGLDRTGDELQKCKEWLLQYQTANDMTLRELDDLCWEDSAWVFDQIFGCAGSDKSDEKLTEREKMIEILSKYFSIGDSYAYNLTRDKAAFMCGTMGFDDFEEFDEETVADIADHLIAEGVVLMGSKDCGTIPVCKGEGTIEKLERELKKIRQERDAAVEEAALASNLLKLVYDQLKDFPGIARGQL